jgi:putative nucleotidyltransferase with HDIG domain
MNQTAIFVPRAGNPSRDDNGILQALAAAVELRDAETQAHSRRVTQWALTLARSMGLSEKEITIIAQAALLHDIGKIGIPDSILRKAGRLNVDEVVVVRRHCYAAYVMMKAVPFLQSAAEIVYAHHECYDGSGYPRGLRGEQIPLGARILAVADTMDAMTSDRSYRAALPLSAVREELKRGTGSQFDPKVVDVFLSLPAPEPPISARHNVSGYALRFAPEAI